MLDAFAQKPNVNSIGSQIRRTGNGQKRHAPSDRQCDEFPSAVLYNRKQDVEAVQQVNCAFRHKDLQNDCHGKMYHIVIVSRTGPLTRYDCTDGQSATDPYIFMHSL